MHREKDVESCTHALMMHYPTVMRASIKEWHREANSLSLIRQVFFQVARTAKQGPGVSGPYIFGFFFLKWGKPFLKSYVHSRIMTKQMIMFVLMLTVWQEQSLFEKCKSFFFFFFLTTWTFWAKESGTGKNVPRPTHRSYYLYSTICSYHQDLALWNIHLSLKTVSIYKKWDVKKKKKSDTYCSSIAASLIHLHWAELLIYTYKIISICQTYFYCHQDIGGI